MFDLKKMFEKKENNQLASDNVDEKSSAKHGKNKKIENLIFFVIVLIITVVIINFTWNNDSTPKEDSTSKLLANESEDVSSELQNTNNLEARLANILKTIDGVGKVQVLINYSESSSVVTMYNENTTKSTTEEEDDSGGTRKVDEVNTQKEIAYTEESGSKSPITEKVIMPVIQGAIITAEGASNANIKANIISAVEAVTGLATHKIQVFEMGK